MTAMGSILQTPVRLSEIKVFCAAPKAYHDASRELVCLIKFVLKRKHAKSGSRVSKGDALSILAPMCCALPLLRLAKTIRRVRTILVLRKSALVVMENRVVLMWIALALVMDSVVIVVVQPHEKPAKMETLASQIKTAEEMIPVENNVIANQRHAPWAAVSLFIPYAKQTSCA